MIIFYIGLIGLLLACFWKIYEKAGREGWEGIVPIYNLYVLTQIIGKPWWWTILMLIPYVNFIWIIWSYNLLAKKFGKTEGFTVGLVLLSFIFFPILAFGDAKFQGALPANEDTDLLDSGVV